MSIRKNTLGPYYDISPELKDVLRKNGMRAHIMREGDSFSLVVKGHDSPLLTYRLDPSQLSNLRDGGTTYANRRAYETFAQILSQDFHLPKDYVHAKNVGSRVAMGIDGYRDSGMPFGFLHERNDGRQRPGELNSGDYGFYYKQKSNDVLLSLQDISSLRRTNLKTGIPYSSIIGSPVYFSKDKWQQILSSHGIVIDEKEKTLKIQSAAINQDFVYDLRDAELKILLDNSIENSPVESRLQIINDIIKNDYSDPVTISMLESKEQIDIPINRANLQVPKQIFDAQQNYEAQNASVDGASLNAISGQGWYRECQHGREVSVGEITAEEVDGKYKMTAIINGESITHEISQKEYQKFLALDDYHRMKLFSKIFPEVDMKGREGEKMRAGIGIGAGILAAVSAVTLFRPRPELFFDHHVGPGHIYTKPGVDSPQDIACRAFDAGVNAAYRGYGIPR